MGNVGQLVTAGQLFEESSAFGRCELIRGEIIPMTPASFNHGEVALNLGILLKAFAKPRKLGRVATNDPGFHIEQDPDTVRAPDVAFVRTERMASTKGRGFPIGVPDIAAEVLSPDDRESEVSAKVQQWLSAGCELVWVVDPLRQAVTVFRRGAQPALLTVDDRLTGGAVLPGFDVPVAEIFAT